MVASSTSKSNRTPSLVISLLGAIFNFALAIQVLAAWRSIRWEPESEWEASVDVWKVDGVKLVWALLTAYFAAAATACLVGFVGIIKNLPSYVRFYRDYSIADFSFCAFFTIIGAYTAYLTSVRAVVCEQLSRQPELMRDMIEMGLNLENCELWFERAVMAFMAIMTVLIIIRLHFLVAVSNYYRHLIRHHRVGLPTHATSHSRPRSSSLQRIYLLPRDNSASSPTCPSSPEDVLVYAPVPLSTFSPKAARDIRSSATEAWISRTIELEPHQHRHRHQTSISSSTSPTGTGTGRIMLPVNANEGLLPGYQEYDSKA